jgi:hypothetical protein
MRRWDLPAPLAFYPRPMMKQAGQDTHGQKRTLLVPSVGVDQLPGNRLAAVLGRTGRYPVSSKPATSTLISAHEEEGAESRVNGSRRASHLVSRVRR